jgi:hypothetical protein
VPVDPPPVPVLELLDAELLLDAALLLLDAELLDAELLDAELPLLDAELLPEAVLVPVPAPPAPPPPALLVEVLAAPPALLVEVALGEEVEDSSAVLDAPPVPSSVPAAQLAGAVAARTAPAAMEVRVATRRPTFRRPDAEEDRGNMLRSSTPNAARAATSAGFWRNVPGLV